MLALLQTLQTPWSTRELQQVSTWVPGRQPRAVPSRGSDGHRPLRPRAGGRAHHPLSHRTVDLVAVDMCTVWPPEDPSMAASPSRAARQLVWPSKGTWVRQEAWPWQNPAAAAPQATSPRGLYQEGGFAPWAPGGEDAADAAAPALHLAPRPWLREDRSPRCPGPGPPVARGVSHATHSLTRAGRRPGQVSFPKGDGAEGHLRPFSACSPVPSGFLVQRGPATWIAGRPGPWGRPTTPRTGLGPLRAAWPRSVPALRCLHSGLRPRGAQRPSAGQTWSF